jgi:hypothetical protein
MAHDNRPVRSQARELPRLELHVPLFVLQNPLAQVSQHGGRSRAVQRGVVHLREDLRDDEDGDGNLEAPEEVAQSSEDAVGEGASDERDPVQLQEAGEVPGMAVLLCNQQPQRIEMVEVAGVVCVAFGIVIEVLPLRALASLKLLDRSRDCGA